MKVTKITLEDKGQDFLELYVDSTGIVIEALPFQSSIWAGAYIPVWADEMVKVGEFCPIHNPPHLMFGSLKYRIESIEQVEYNNFNRMNTRINEIIATLKEGQAVTVVLRNGEQLTGFYRGTDGDDLILRAKSGDAPDLGWNVDAIDDIIPENVEPAGDVVKIDFTDLKTGRRVAMTIDVSGDEGKITAEFIPTVEKGEDGQYAVLAMRFMKMLATGNDDAEDDDTNN